MRSSKLTSQFQITIAQDIRTALKLKIGDQIVFETTKEGQVVVKKAMPADLAYLKAVESTLSKWNSDNDEQDYNDL